MNRLLELSQNDDIPIRHRQAAYSMSLFGPGEIMSLLDYQRETGDSTQDAIEIMAETMEMEAL